MYKYLCDQAESIDCLENGDYCQKTLNKIIFRQGDEVSMKEYYDTKGCSTEMVDLCQNNMNKCTSKDNLS